MLRAFGGSVKVKHVFGVAAAAAVLLASSAAPACSLHGGTKKVTIPADYPTADHSYTLLYSTLGYESAATKRVLIRQNDTAAPVSAGLAFTWLVVDAKGSQVAAGHATYAGTAWSIPLWAADFSQVTKAGEYRMLVEAPDVHLATDAFPVDQFVMFKTTYAGIALENAEARAAPIELDNGYFASNDRSGSVADHAGLLVGLLESFARRGSSLTDDERTRTRAAIDRAVDYLLLLSDPASGEIGGQSNTRPYGDSGPFTTAAGLRGLAHFAAVAQNDEPGKADRAFRRAKLAEAWLDANAPEAYPASLRAAVDYDLYRVGGDKATLDRATNALRDAVSSYDLRTMDRRSGDTLPHFEAMYRMWRDLPSHPDRAFWEQTARTAAASYRDMMARSVFQLVPPGVTDAQEGTSASAQWDQVETLPPPGEGIDAVIGNDWFMSRTIDAIYLAEITHDASLEKAATGSLEWVTGLNAGVPAERVVDGATGSPYEAASFVTGLGGRSVATWSPWEWQRVRPFATIVNGFRQAFVFDDVAAAGGTSIRHDGLWLYATAVYEDYLNPGRRAARPDAAPTPSPGVHASSAVGSESAGFMQLLVTVLGPEGNAAVGAKVSVAWTGPLAPGVSPDDAVRVTQCVTAVGGSCFVALATNALPVQRPIMAVVTNIEHPRYLYDVTKTPAPVLFP
jgi:hypothetical protein